MHSRIMHPALRDIKDALESGFEKVEQTGKEPRGLLAVSWAARVLRRFDSSVESRISILFKPLVESRFLGSSEGLGGIRVQTLMALFNSAQMLLASNQFDGHSLRKGFNQLLLKLDRKNWLSSVPLASYALYGLRGIADDALLNQARSFIIKYFGSELSDAIVRCPEVALGIPELCKSILGHQDELVQELRSGSYRRAALILFVVSDKLDDPEMESLKEWSCHILKEFESLVASNPTEQGLLPISCVGLAIINMKLDDAYLLTGSQYSKIRIFFEGDTVPVRRAVEYAQEVIILLVTLAMLLLLSIHGGLLLAALLTNLAGAAAGDLAVNLAANIVMIFMDVMFIGIIFPRLLPQLWRDLGKLLKRGS